MTPQELATATEKGDAFERRVADAFERIPLPVTWPPHRSQPSYDFVVTAGQHQIVVQCKDVASRLVLKEIKSFAGFMASAEAKRFRGGYFVTTSPLTKGAAEFVDKNPQFRIVHKILRRDNVLTTAGQLPFAPVPRRIVVFTAKGGVGKTKLSLLLSCALGHRGKSVFMVDVNRAQNLANLAGDHDIFVGNKQGPEAVISVFARREWSFTQNRWKGGNILNADFIIYDCPQFIADAAEKHVLAHADYVIAPIQLTIDSIGVDYSVLRQTIDTVRSHNAQVPVEFVLNAVHKAQMESGLFAYLKSFRPLLAEMGESVAGINTTHMPYSQSIEQLGADRALAPANAIRLLFSREAEGEPRWLPNIVKLADQIIARFSVTPPAPPGAR